MSNPALVGASDLGVVSWTLDLYRSYADKSLAGQVPYRDYLVEYPIAAFPLFLIPRLIVADAAGYRVVFITEMLLFDAAAAYLVARRVEQAEGIAAVPARLGWYTLLFASLCPLALGRYDLASMAIAFAAVCWWFSGRYALGGAAAGVGTLVKIFPGAVAAPALLWEAARLRDSRGRGPVAFLISLFLLASLWIAIGGDGVLDFLRFHAERGLEVESTYSGLLYLVGRVAGVKITSGLDHGSFNVTSSWGGPIAMTALPIQAAALLLVMWRYRQSGMADGIRYAGAAVLAFMALGKVLSPQFLIWPIPFLAALGGRTGRWARWLYLPCCLATMQIYPGGPSTRSWPARRGRSAC